MSAESAMVNLPSQSFRLQVCSNETGKGIKRDFFLRFFFCTFDDGRIHTFYPFLFFFPFIVKEHPLNFPESS